MNMAKIGLLIAVCAGFYFFPLYMSLAYVFTAYSIMGYLHAIALTDNFTLSEFLFTAFSWLIAPVGLLLVVFVLICAKEAAKN